MNANEQVSRRTHLGGYLGVVSCAALVAGLALCGNGAAAQTPAKSPATGQKSEKRAVAGPQEGQQTFASAAEASQALIAALHSDDQPALLKMLGPSAKDIVDSGDETADKNEREQIAEKYKQMHRLVMEPDGMTTLYVGAENWPTPIPLAHKGSVWYFDTAAGKQQILYRRIGRNELATIQVCRELVDAEKEYYSQPHDGDSGNHYAEKLFSDPSKHNGLYWKASSGEPESPIGPLIAQASAEGYAEPTNQEPQPFDGYLFKMLKAPGATGGFAFMAFPAKYRASGVMSFVVGQDGVVYEKDLGAKTDDLAKAMARYRRDATWRKAD